MLSGDGGLQRIRTSAAAQGFVDERQCLGDLCMIPSAAILLFQNNQIPGRIEAGIAPRVVQQHESEQSGCFPRRLRSHQRPY